MQSKKELVEKHARFWVLVMEVSTLQARPASFTLR